MNNKPKFKQKFIETWQGLNLEVGNVITIATESSVVELLITYSEDQIIHHRDYSVVVISRASSLYGRIFGSTDIISDLGSLVYEKLQEIGQVPTGFSYRYDDLVDWGYDL